MNLELDKPSWKRVRLGDVITRSRKQVDPIQDGVGRYVAGGHIDSDSVTVERWGDPADGQMGSTFRYVFEPGQVLFVSARPYLRKTGVVQFSGVVADKTYVLDAIPENGLLQAFLPFVLSSDRFVEYATAEATGSMNPRLLWGPLQCYEFDLPPLDEQKRIADLLWAAEQHRCSLDRQSTQMRSTFAAEVQQQFESAVGPERAIVDLCESVIGGVWGAPAGEGEVDVLALGPKSYSGDVVFVNPDGCPTRSITKKQATGRILRAGDIVLERSGGSFDQAVGRVMIAGPDLPDTIPTDFQRLLRPDQALVEPAYLFWKLRLDWLLGVTRDYARRTTNISNLAVPDYLARTLVVPSRSDQLALVSRVDQWRHAATQADREVESLAALRASLLAEIFGGN